jgi:DNA-binding NarL/FixJ family response regulator
MPSFKSSPWMRGAPHKGFAVAIVLTSAAISVSMRGRPPVGRRESWVQYSRKRRQIRQYLGTGVRLIALTGYGRPEDRQRAGEAGFDGLVVKPVSPEQLSEILRTVNRPKAA